MSTRLAGRLRRLASQRIAPLLARPFWSLPSRMIVSVFAAALVTSLVVTWMSTRSIESFLRAKIDEKFPSILRSTSERLELWYGQRELDLKIFAGSVTVAESLGTLGERDDQKAREELSTYLVYVMERFPQYEALFVMDPQGRTLLRTGREIDLPFDLRRSLARVRGAGVSDLHVLDGVPMQLVSAGIEDQGGRSRASLHAALRLDALEEALRSDDVGSEGGIYVVGADGGVLLRSPGAPIRTRYDRGPPAAGDAPVEEYTHDGGARVVGSALRFPRFSWTIVVEEAYEQAFAPVVAVIREILAINLAVVLVFGVIAYQMARSITRPILALSEAANRIAVGETDVKISGPTPDDEIGVLTRAFNDMSQRLRENQEELEGNRLEIEEANSRLVSQNRELARVNEVFLQLSITDELTRLHNHRFFRDHLPREVKRSERTDDQLCLILIDIDDFKQLNDRYGHAVGDTVLQQVAEVMSEAIRETDLLARYGGEEFALLAGHTPLEGAVALAEKMRRAIARKRFAVEDRARPKRISITASFGVSLYQGDEKAFFTDADGALYDAKASGKDCVVAAPLRARAKARKPASSARNPARRSEG